jgi:hypothetical protein
LTDGEGGFHPDRLWTEREEIEKIAEKGVAFRVK